MIAIYNYKQTTQQPTKQPTTQQNKLLKSMIFTIKIIMSSWGVWNMPPDGLCCASHLEADSRYARWVAIQTLKHVMCSLSTLTIHFVSESIAEVSGYYAKQIGGVTLNEIITNQCFPFGILSMSSKLWIDRYLMNSPSVSDWLSDYSS